MIVCSCNVLTAEQILSTLQAEEAARPRTARQAYHCLGCAPQCGRCLPHVQALLKEAQINCSVGCADCPAHQNTNSQEKTEVILIQLAAE